ncbi:hypothetical protein LTR05_006730 [Lithohypha guttulata]|uniref:GAR domain-containing protein n=1 Tax=Lithohypha guttulata TaxID=1690604 RepID=A0AAN7Y524_9EURO|nr:hypothetical protein LTR05_006730 [Lithohypha guttulata]
MTAMQPNPTHLSVSTQLPPPAHKRNFSTSRSPSRSPTRKAQFAARELDPLLKNLSPDSTLEALQQADAIGRNQAEQNAIARSILDASESERKLGIRAAIAAKKLKEWTNEVAAWSWPSSTDRAWGAGFIAPESKEAVYYGSLPEHVVQQYEDRLDEIWDAIDTLGMDEIKEYVFSSHHPTSQSSASLGYGRMRDFTALVTATVIQSFPVLANLQILLETWSIRLTVLRQIPDLITTIDQVKLGLVTINKIVQDEVQSRKLNKRELETGKALFGTRVSNLGKRVDDLLDMLEGQEDSLPQAWINDLENIENKYAEWVAQAERVVLRNQMAQDTPHRESQKSGTPTTSPAKVPLPASPDPIFPTLQHSTSLDSTTSSMVPSRSTSSVKRKPLREVNPKPDQGHRRGVSEISMAESTFSNYSIENAEIMDARATPVLPSPRISIIGSSTSTNKNGFPWMTGRSDSVEPQSSTRPPIMHRASVASVEFVPKEQIRKVVLQKSASYDMLANLNRPRSTFYDDVTKAQMTSPVKEAGNPLADHDNTFGALTPLPASPSPSLRVDPLSLRGAYLAANQTLAPPLVPRRSSKRLSLPVPSQTRMPSPPPETVPLENDEAAVVGTTNPVPETPRSNLTRAETFDDKLKSILASMPAKIRLANGSDSGSSDASSETSSRASSPSRVLKLSPAKGRDSAGNNPNLVRIYHLRNPRLKDAPPVKLFVRAVGENGDRIMVRVGGGWADLAEYLREYSLHHGGRGLTDDKLQVSGYPGVQGPESLRKTAGPGQSHPQATVPDQNFDFGLADNDRPKSAEEKKAEMAPWRPPPVPVVPPNYDLPIARSTSPARFDRPVRISGPMPSYRPASRVSTTTTTSPAVTTTVTMTNRYTPLGGAGPVPANRRTPATNPPRTPTNDAWVETMMSKARAASGSQVSHNHSHSTRSPTLTSTSINNSTTVTAPTTTTTTTIISPKTRVSALNNNTRRVSSWSTTSTPLATNNNSGRPSAISTPQGSHLDRTSSVSAESSTSANHLTQQRSKSPRRRSIMGLGDVGGIRRVFLRKKSDQ